MEKRYQSFRLILVKTRAFSLVELLISLIVISCVAAAFAPVITKRLKSSTVSVGAMGAGLKTNCTTEKIFGTETYFTSDCKLCHKGKCVLCNVSCSENQYRDNETCQCINCTNVSANCEKCDKDICKKCTSGYGLATNTCTQCQKGEYSDGFTPCKVCPDGMYQDDVQKNMCMPCGAGTYSASNHQSCIACSAGTYQPNIGQTSCMNCPDGYITESSKTECKRCANGQYVESNTCKNCPAGTYAPSPIKASTCPECPAGHIAPSSGAITCSLCPPGTYSVNRTYCDYCADNTWSINGVDCLASLCTEGHMCSNGIMTPIPVSGQQRFETAGNNGSWTIPNGITKITLTLISGGNSSTAGSSTNGSVATNTGVQERELDLTSSTYSFLKGKTVTVKGCGAGGNPGTAASWGEFTEYANTYYGTVPGAAGSGGTFNFNMAIPENTTKIILHKGLKEESDTNREDSYIDRIHSGYSSGAMKGGNGGKGGGVSYVNLTVNSVSEYPIVAGGGGGGGGCTAATDNQGSWAIGGRGADGGTISACSNCFGEGGAQKINKNKGNHNGNDAKNGETYIDSNYIASGSTNQTYSNSLFCTAEKDGYIEMSWTATIGSGGNSGYCYKIVEMAVTSNAVVSNIYVGAGGINGAGEASSIKIGNTTYSSNNGTVYNSSNGTLGGAGFNAFCNNGTYGKGGDGSTSSTLNPGNVGAVIIDYS